MIYVFCDEDQKASGPEIFLRYAAVAFYQDHYNRLGEGAIDKLFDGGHPQIQQIIEMLKKTDGLVLLTQARIPKSRWLAKEAINTSDIPKMTPPNFFWSVSMALTIGCLFPILTKRCWSYSTVDVYYDPKSLTAVNRTRILEYLQQKLPDQVKEFRKTMYQKVKCNIRRIQEVPKSESGSPPDKYQLGIRVADRLVRKYDLLDRINVMDLISFRDITRNCLSMYCKHAVTMNDC